MMKKILSVLIAFVIAAAMFVFQPEYANAENGGWKFTIKNNHIFEGREASYTINNVNNEKRVYEVLYMYSSNPDVVKIKEDEYSSYFDILAKKPGKATVYARILDDKNYIYELPCTVTVKRYPHHIKSLSVNGKTIKLKGENRFFHTKVTKKTKVKVKIALKKGWKISSVKGYYVDLKTDHKKNIKGIKKAIVKGRSFKFPKKYYVSEIHITMKKGKQTMKYDLSLVRGIIDY